MANELTVPFAGQKASKAFSFLHEEPRESLADGIGSAMASLTYRGGKWWLKKDKIEHQIVRKDDGSASSSVDVVILRQAKNLSKMFYDTHGEPYNEQASKGKRPDCASSDGIRPDPGVPHQQADACSLCKRNEFITRPNGRKGKDCQDHKRLAVLLLPTTITSPPLDASVMEPVFLKVPPDSLRNLSSFAELIDRKGYHFAEMVTRLKLDQTTTWPKIEFHPLQLLSDNEGEVVQSLRSDPQALRITGEAGGSTPVLAPPKEEKVVETGLGFVANPNPTNGGADPYKKVAEQIDKSIQYSDEELDKKLAELMVIK